MKIDIDQLPDYNFLYAPGSCGQFLVGIMCKHFNPLADLYITDLGDVKNASGGFGIKAAHNSNVMRYKQKGQKVALILFDDNDIDLIAKMHYYKTIALQLDKLNHMFSGDPVTEIKSWVVRWKNEIVVSEADYCFNFKSLIGISGSIEQEVADFLGVDSLHVNAKKLIEEYQQINKTLYLNAGKTNN